MSAIWTPLMAIYDYDPTILDGLHVPTADELPNNIEYISPLPELSDEDLRMELLFELGELAPVYSDPKTLRQMVELWSRINHNNFLMLWQTTLYKYNPIWNKDGTYSEVRIKDGTISTSDSLEGTVSTTSTEEGEQSGTNSVNENVETSGEDLTTHHVTGYDTDSMSPAYDDELEHSETTGRTVTGSDSRSDSRTGSGTATTTEERTGYDRHNERETFEHIEQGNIGVTTTQAMINEQREIVTFNIYSYIIEAFKKRFMIQIY